MSSKKKPVAQIPPPGYDLEAAGPVEGQETKSPLKKAPSRPTHRVTYSSGSTRGAFYNGESRAPQPVGGVMPKKKNSKRGDKRHSQSQVPPPQQPQPQYPNMGTGSDLGDVASMAIAGLGDDINMAELMGTAAPPPKSRRQQNGAAGPPNGYNRRKKQSPPSSVGAQLETIPDVSEHHHDDVANAYSRRTSARNKRGSVDSLRVSDASHLDMDTEEMKNLMNGLDRDSFAIPGSADLVGTSFADQRPPQQSSLRQPIPRQANKAYNSGHRQQPSQEQEIANFAAMLHADYGAADARQGGSPQVADRKQPPPAKQAQGPPPPSSRGPPPPRVVEQVPPAPKEPVPYVGTSTEDEMSDETLEDVSVHRAHLIDYLDPTNWLTSDVKFQDGVPYFDDSAGWTMSGFVRYLFFNPISPEFTSLQQFSWAVIIGIFMGFYTAYWKEIIEKSVDFMWKDVPETLLEWGLFTELDGIFPLYHYMWICPAFWGGLLSYIFVILPTPIPGQNEWIQNVHTQGVQGHETFLQLFVLATLGMASGLSLGPELPLILTAGMLGSWLGIICKQSVLQARVMNITAASAAIGGFFGFPMAGALFVLEVPHRMGLQYFEALSPATIASIVAVLCNRLVTGNDVTGYYKYPFLTETLPSEIFTSAIVFGLFGALVGTIYTQIVLKLKGFVHDFFHAPHDHHDDEDHHHGEAEGEEHGQTEVAPGHDDVPEEKTPLVGKQSTKSKNAAPPEVPFHRKVQKAIQKYFCFVIPYEPYRAAAAGVVAGAMVGVICMFVPHVLFWGEAQLQTLIDKGRTPLPVFGQGNETTAALTHYAYCLIDPTDAAAVRAGFGIECSFVITLAKIVTTGLSLGTGIIGGHFWGPLFAGCAASHFLTSSVKLISDHTGFGGNLAAYPCVTILCTMGSTHVVTFRAHMAIMLILTLTISAFDPQDGGGGNAGVAGDYSAVFPLLVISVFVSLMLTRQQVFYTTQRSRGDIMALPEVLCEPGKEGMPMVLDYEPGEGHGDEDDESDYSSDEGYQSDRDVVSPRRAATEKRGQSPSEDMMTQDAIERDFNAMNANAAQFAPSPPLPPQDPYRNDRPRAASRERANSQDSRPRSRGVSPLPPRPGDRQSKKTISGNTPPPSGPPSVTGADAGGGSEALGDLSTSRLDELLSKPLDYQRPQRAARHRRIQSAPDANFATGSNAKSQRFARSRANSSFNQGEEGSETGSTGGGEAPRHARHDSYGSQNSGAVQMRVTSFGQLTVEQPSLMEQARLRSATSVIVESRHVRNPSMPSRLPRSRGHSRQNSASSAGANSVGGGGVPTGPPLQVAVATADRNAVPASEVERAYSTAIHQQMVGRQTQDGSNRGSPIPPEEANTG